MDDNNIIGTYTLSTGKTVKIRKPLAPEFIKYQYLLYGEGNIDPNSNSVSMKRLMDATQYYATTLTDTSAEEFAKWTGEDFEAIGNILNEYEQNRKKKK